MKEINLTWNWEDIRLYTGDDHYLTENECCEVLKHIWDNWDNHHSFFDQMEMAVLTILKEREE